MTDLSRRTALAGALSALATTATAKPRLSNKEAALELSGLSNGSDPTRFTAMDLPEDLIGTNTEWVETIIIPARIALATCVRDRALVTETVSALHSRDPAVVTRLYQDWERAAEYLGDVISLMALAAERFEIVAKELDIELNPTTGVST